MLYPSFASGRISVSSSLRFFELVPTTSCHHRSKKTVCLASSTIWVERKISISGVGAAHTNGASVVVTRSSPLKKRRTQERDALFFLLAVTGLSFSGTLQTASPAGHYWASRPGEGDI